MLSVEPCTLFIDLFITLKPKSRHCGVSAHQRQGKREEGKTRRRAKKRKGVEAQRVKQFTSFQAIDEHIGDEEQNRK